MIVNATGGPLQNKRGVTVGWHNLFCPRCEEHSVMISASTRYSTLNRTSYTAQCRCGYSVDFLGSDGTLRKAVAEWKQLCRAAAQVKQQLLGEQKMKSSEQLDLFEVTEWIDCLEHLPETSGWYDVRYKMSEEERESREATEPTRRWWHGDAQCWSWPVVVGNSTDEDEAEARARLARVTLVPALEWRGLVSQHPALYLRRR